MTWFDWNAELQSPALGCAQYTAVKYISNLFLPLSEGRKELCHEYNGAFRNLLTWTSRQPPRTSKQMLSNVSTTSQNTLMTTKYEFCNQNNHGQVLHIFSLVKNAEFGLHCNKPSETGPKKKKKCSYSPVSVNTAIQTHEEMTNSKYLISLFNQIWLTGFYYTKLY